jgi:hypothetical protein
VATTPRPDPRVAASVAPNGFGSSRSASTAREVSTAAVAAEKAAEMRTAEEAVVANAAEEAAVVKAAADKAMVMKATKVALDESAMESYRGVWCC